MSFYINKNKFEHFKINFKYFLSTVILSTLFCGIVNNIFYISFFVLLSNFFLSILSKGFRVNSVFWGINFTFVLFFSGFCEVNHFSFIFELKFIFTFLSAMFLPFLNIAIFNKIKFAVFIFTIAFTTSFLNFQNLQHSDLFFLLILSCCVYYYFNFSWSDKTLVNVTLQFFLTFLIKTNHWLLVFSMLIVLVFSLYFLKNRFIQYFLYSIQNTTILQYCNIVLIVFIFLILQSIMVNNFYMLIIVWDLFFFKKTIFYTEINPFLHPFDFALLNIENIPKTRCQPLTQCSKITLTKNKIFMIPNRDYITSLKKNEIQNLSAKCILNHSIFFPDSVLTQPKNAPFVVGILTSSPVVDETRYSNDKKIALNTTFSSIDSIAIESETNIVGQNKKQYLSPYHYPTTLNEIELLAEKPTFNQQNFNEKYQFELTKALDQTQLNRNKHTLKDQVIIEQKTKK